MDKNAQKFILFKLDTVCHALSVDSVNRVILAVEITPVTNHSNEAILGVINLQGQIVPVIDIRTIFHLSPRVLTVNDQMIIFKSASGELRAFVADEVVGVTAIDIDLLASDKESTGTSNGETTLANPEFGVLFIHNPESLMTSKEVSHG